VARQKGGDARLQLGAEVAPPTENGELVFEAPWEARIFALAHHLCDAGLFHWDEFRKALIAEVAQWDAAHPKGEGYVYYERFQAALEALLAERGVVAPSVLDAETAKLEARPHGHDHAHG
jgi:nitrile hydratase accessory protein